MDFGDEDLNQVHGPLDHFCDTLETSIGTTPPRIRKGQKQRAGGPPPPGLNEDQLPTSSGYLPVSRSSQSRLFYVFYEASESCNARSRTPLLLWLNGGPGCSSLIGCFYEIGPFLVGEDGAVHSNPWAWNRRFGVLYHSPVGTGFSVAESDDDIPRSTQTVAQQLHYALEYFIAQNDGFSTRPLFLAGESYAGKYVPALAHKILQQQPARENGSRLSSQLAGIMIGNGLTDPRTQVQCHADFALSFGLLDKRQAAHVQKMAKEAVEFVDREEWAKPHERRTALCTFMERTSGVPTLLDIRRTTKYHHTQDGIEFLAQFLNSPKVKAALNVDHNAQWISCQRKVRASMIQDTMKSTKCMVEVILREGIPILLYQGVYDAKDGPAGTEAWMRTLQWQGSSLFWRFPRNCWKVDGVLAGYWREGLNLTQVVVVGAGHQVPVDQPLNSQVMVETWIGEQLEKRA